MFDMSNESWSLLQQIFYHFHLQQYFFQQQTQPLEPTKFMMACLQKKSFADKQRESTNFLFQKQLYLIKLVNFQAKHWENHS